MNLLSNHETPMNSPRKDPMPSPKKESPEPYERARLQSLRSQLTYSEEQLAIFKRKAEAEEMRANKLLAQNATLNETNSRLTERVGELFGKVLLRDEGIVQTVLHFTEHGDPASEITSAAPQGRG